MRTQRPIDQEARVNLFRISPANSRRHSGVRVRPTLAGGR